MAARTMRILAFDTAGPALSVSVTDGRRTLGALHRPLERGHAELLLPAIKGVLKGAGTVPAELDAIATTVGPGSFTGLRTGLAAAQGLSLGIGKPVVGISRFEALAQATGAFCERPIVVAMDSKARSLYVQAFDASGLPAEGWPGEGLNRAADAFDGVVWPAGALAIGDGVAALRAHVRGLQDTGRRQLPAAAVAACARRALEAGHTGLPAEPLYLAPPRAVRPHDGGRIRLR